MDRDNVYYGLGLLAFAALSMLSWHLYRGGESQPSSVADAGHYHGPHGAEEHVEEGLLPHGPHGGMLLEDRDLAIELVRHEHQTGQWLYAYAFSDDQRPLPPTVVQLRLEFSNNGLSETVRLQPDSREGLALSGQAPEDLLKGWQLKMLAQHEQHAHEWMIENFMAKQDSAMRPVVHN
ncbi:hypothetical protein HPT27_11450 [Permianibacter sp. IMCC34836]|uniref:hypothetical protein n=1 Tax=Permianibacter fluminis TaxID=2738515 RepID=UPI001557873A|nr:hypothetical protein [Permianibacter fluminis]NQD37641.1 hypothetical protein [Permianibacter fluminis]